MSLSILCPSCRGTVDCEPVEAQRPKSTAERSRRVRIGGRWFLDKELNCDACRKTFALSDALLARRVRSEKELGEALKDGRDTIIVEGDLAKKVVRIRATGAIAWAIAIAAISAVVILVATSSTGVGAPAAAPFVPVAGGAAVAVLGTGTTISAVLVAVAAGGVAALNRLRKYKEVERSSGRVVLKRR